ncbi:MAG: transcriptional repressor [Anaerolineales bacterium]|nr:transcriptional repressor [Anaerolineales bacterium]
MRTSSVDKLILALLEKEDGHLTANRIFKRLQPRLPALNASTVYRALERLAHGGQVSVSDMGTGAVVYAGVSRPLHHHLVCQQCRRTVTIDDAALRPLFEAIGGRFDFQLTTNHLILFGLCPACRKEKG